MYNQQEKCLKYIRYTQSFSFPVNGFWCFNICLLGFHREVTAVTKNKSPYLIVRRVTLRTLCGPHRFTLDNPSLVSG